MGRYGLILAAERAVWRARVVGLAFGEAALSALVWLVGVVVLAVAGLATRAGEQADVLGGVMGPETGPADVPDQDTRQDRQGSTPAGVRVVPGTVLAVRDQIIESERA